MAKDRTGFLSDLDAFPPIEVIPRESPPPLTLDQRYGSAIVSAARLLVGKREQRGNRGPFVARLLRAVGILDPAPWCTAFAVDCCHVAAAAIGRRSNCPRYASGAKLWRWALRHREDVDLVELAEDLRPGDVVILGATAAKAARIRAGRLASGHTYISTSAAYGPQGIHDTVEGNTDASGSRDGGGVEERIRAWSDPRLVGAIRFAALPLPETDVVA